MQKNSAIRFSPAITFHCGDCGELYSEHGTSWQIVWRFVFGPASVHICTNRP